MALYLGKDKVAPTITIEKTLPSMKAFFEAGGKCTSSAAKSFEGCWQYSDTENVTDMNSMFYSCEKLTTIPQFNTENVTNMSCMFYNCSSLITIPQLDTSKVTDMGSMFGGCSSLKEIHMINIGADLSISASTKFTREALVEIIGNLKTVTSTMKLTMGSTNLAKLTDADKKVATDKGWTLA